MILQEGKTYRTRSGDVTTVEPSGRDEYPWIGLCGFSRKTWTDSGHLYAPGKLSNYDLVSEVIPVTETQTKLAHPHAEVIKAWADGAEIEFRDSTRNVWSLSVPPLWSLGTEYRVKPEPVPNVVTWHGVNRWSVDSSCMDRSDINTTDGQIVAILRIEIDHTDPANPVLVSATLEKP